MAILRQYLAPFLILLTFVVALLAVSSRIFLAGDMVAPAPIEPPALVSKPLVSKLLDQRAAQPGIDSVANLPPALADLVQGMPEDPLLGEQL